MKRLQISLGILILICFMMFCQIAALAIVTNNDLAAGSLPRLKTVYCYLTDGNDNYTTGGCASVLDGASIYESDEVTTTITTGITNPDTPRNLRYRLWDASSQGSGNLSATVAVTGINVYGLSYTETVEIDKTDQADGSTSFSLEGDCPFATITSISVIMANDAAGDKLFIGQGPKIGFPIRMGAEEDIFKVMFNNQDENIGTVDIEFSTYYPTGTVDGSDTVIIWIRSTDKGYNVNE